ncbi:MAG TPA: lysyl oxidase family protein [Solirubrobacterales bacterium]|nr:lysyl oxidase family protein [Solirubrobacterales bacterium]
MKSRLFPVLAALSAAFALLAGVALAAPGGAAAPLGPDNPCEGPEARQLLCPDLKVGPAQDLFAVGRGGGYGGGGGTLLYAGNNIMSRGRGPMELRGRRYKRNWMRANQAIYEVGGGVRIFRTDARLHFFDVGYAWGGSYWKVENPLSMEIWSLDEGRRPLERVREGPKVFYCFRDLERTRAMRRSPPNRVYPGCSQDPSRKRVRLGTSVGWSDIYPAEYDRQWVNVSGLRGCFAFVMRVDPRNLLYESNERNNRSVRIVRLPYRDGAQRC